MEKQTNGGACQVHSVIMLKSFAAYMSTDVPRPSLEVVPGTYAPSHDSPAVFFLY